MNPQKLLNNLIDIFGTEYEISDPQFRINCFMCDDHTGHLEINFVKGIFHCWKCDYSGRVMKLFKDYMGECPFGSEDEYISAEDLTVKTEPDEEKTFSGLPEEFVPLWEKTDSLSEVGKRALKYALTRMSKEDIEIYRLGYCGLGKYKWRIIIPIMEDGQAVYFTSRAFLPGVEPKHLHPSREECGGIGKEEIVFNAERALKTGQVVVTEGIFDSIRVGKDGVAIFGTVLSDMQILRIQDANRFYVMLDQDAEDKAEHLAERLKRHHFHPRRVYLVKLPKGDPCDYTREELRRFMDKAEEYKL